MTRRSHRHAPFALRLTGTLVLTLAAVGAAQYGLAASALTDQVLAQGLAGQAGDAEVARTLYEPGAADPLVEVRALLGHIGNRPGVGTAVLVAPDGSVAAVGGGRSHGARHAGSDDDRHGGQAAQAQGATGHAASAAGHATGHAAGHAAEQQEAEEAALPPRVTALAAAPSVVQVLAGGPAVAVRHDGSADLVHAVPVELGGERHVLAVTRSSQGLDGQVAAVGRVLLVTLCLGALLGLPLFFLVGGRALAARHGAALARATSDGLTGLRNHRSFHEDLEALVRDPQAGAHSLALLDLDGFKQVNDTRGHRSGDEVLVAVGRVLARHVPAGAAYRVGGDEFALLLPLAPQDAAGVCDALRCEVADLVLGVTASAGVAALDEHRAGAYAAADTALYEAKRGGRDRVVVAQPGAAPVPALA